MGEPREEEIDGTRYRFSKVPWLQGSKVYRRLIHYGGEVLINGLILMPAEKRKAMLAGENPAATFTLIARTFGAMDDADMLVIMSVLLAATETPVGESSAWETVWGSKGHFDGRYKHMLHVLWRAAAFNFSDF